jgi:hypothetical protein
MLRALSLGTLTAALFALLWSRGSGDDGPGDDEPSDEVRALMRQKLEHAQKILEGSTSEDYGLVQKHAAQLRELTGEKEWKVLPTVEYNQLSMEFLRAAESLEAAAKDKDQDAVDLAYLNLTIKCMYCHKYVRTTREARLDFGRLRR